MMKTKFFTGALIALIAVACSEKEPLQPVAPSAEGLKVTASVEQPGTRTSLDGLNVKWTVGDRIYLTDGTHTAIYEATEASISTSFAYVSGDTTLEGDVYAYYPAENVTGFDAGTFTATIPAVQPYVAGGFADGINPMTAKATVYDDALVLQFRNVMSFIGLQFDDIESDKLLYGLSIESPSAALCGTASVAVDEDGVAAVSVTGSNKVDLDQVSIYLSTNPSPAYIAVPAGNVGKLTITALTEELGGSFSQEKVALNSLDAERSVINRYSVMSISSFNKKTLCPSDPANCYMINREWRDSIIIPLSQAIAGWDAIKALEPADDFDVSKITSGERTIAVRWLDGATGTITKKSIDDQNLKLMFGDDCQNGTNAVVDLKNGDETVWSWHLWFTDYRPAGDQTRTLNGQVHTYSGPAFKAGGLYYGKVMMDRNLGATIIGVSGAIAQPTTNSDAVKYFGLFYQFGRKDPFSSTAAITKQNIASSEVTYAFAAQTPAVFFSNTIADTWASTDAEKNNENMTDPWNSNGPKSAFDPCPAGWRIPICGLDASTDIWNGIKKTNFTNAYDGEYKTGGFLWSGAWLPAAGTQEGKGTYKTAINTGAIMYIWSASPFDTGKGYCIFFRASGGASTNKYTRTTGNCVRCIKE